MQYLKDLWAALDLGSLEGIVLRLASVFLCLTIHESCHGLAAYALGDPTAKRAHRLSLNPLRHIDWIGFSKSSSASRKLDAGPASAVTAMPSLGFLK